MSLKERIRRWLGAAEAKHCLDENLSLVDKLNEFEAGLKKFCEIECTQCGTKVVTYPFGGGYYREADGAVICSGQCLDARDAGNQTI